MLRALMVPDYPRLALWLKWRIRRRPRPARKIPRRAVRDIAALPAHLRRDIGLPD